jgi:hypothetical protein
MKFILVTPFFIFTELDSEPLRRRESVHAIFTDLFSRRAREL